MRCLPTILCLLLSVTSCNLIDSMVHNTDEKRVAKVGREILYESDVVKLMPSGVSSEDSVQMIESYAKIWAVSKLMVIEAEKRLSKTERNVDNEVEEFRRNLLHYRYEQKMLSEGLDTLVTSKEISSYYQEHADNYILPYTVVKARVIRISPKSPYYDQIKEGYIVSDPYDVSQLEQLCYTSAEKYVDFGKEWTSVSSLAKELGQDVEECLSELKNAVYERDADGQHYLVYIIDRADAGTPVPLDYCKKNVIETILAKRKQDFLKSLEQELLDEAIRKKQLIIYTKDE